MSEHAIVRELNMDCLVGPTHFFGGLSFGNIASLHNKSMLSNPKKAALQGLEKMRYLAHRGFAQAVMPPHDRPDFQVLRLLGFNGSDELVLKKALQQIPDLVPRLCSSSAMWAANAATVCPRSDAQDNKTHIIPANLVTMFHRSLEAVFTTKIFRRIFNNTNYFTIHDPLPQHDIFSDEGAANHNRLCPNHAACGLHIFVHGKKESISTQASTKYPARQSLLANKALERLAHLRPNHTLHAAQNPLAIDAGAFHNDVVSVANESVFLCHELAFVDQDNFLLLLESEYQKLYSSRLNKIIISQQDLPIENAVSTYLFNSQLITKANQKMLLFAPTESQQDNTVAGLLEKIVADDNPIDEVVFFDISESMANGGGPACLRLRIPLAYDEYQALDPRIFMDDNLYNKLYEIINNFYTDKLTLENLLDKNFLEQSRRALDNISQVLGLPKIYSWQI